MSRRAEAGAVGPQWWRGWRGRIARSLLAVAAGLLVPEAANAQPGEPARIPRWLAAWTESELVPFESEAELRRYLGAARRAARERNMWWSRSADEDSGGIVVTGSRITPSNPSITNVQEAGVDEGDIVKQIDRFLVVLSDGRLFSIDTGAGLALADRVDVYRDRGADTWYDEMLVRGDLILVTGYSYRQDASEFTLFRLGPDGRLTRQSVFYISSDDYYDTGNYATRLIGDNLVLYTPVQLTGLRPGERMRVPRLRYGEPPEPVRGREGEPLFDWTEVYRPLQTTFEPVIHSITICPLDALRAGRRPMCRTRAFVGPESRRFYVSPTDAYLWLAPGWEDFLHSADEASCAAGTGEAIETVVYRIPIGRGDPSVIALRGFGFDQFSIDVHDGQFRAFTGRTPAACSAEMSAPPAALALAQVPLGRFDAVLRHAPQSAYAAIPLIESLLFANRFTDTHLVYAALPWSRRVDRDRYTTEPAKAVAVPLARPGDARLLELGHTVIRAERAGDDVVLTGYGDQAGLSVSLIDLAAVPRVASTLRLEGRFESEGRSHAFNSLLAPDGSGVLALPTSPRIEDSGRDWWRSRASDLSYLTLDPGGRLAPAGELRSTIVYDTREGQDEDGVAGYECEVSCVDWYGNSRPIFTDGRIFALTGVELVEGRIESGRIREVRRLNIAVPGPGSDGR